MQWLKPYISPTINLSLRSIFHVFVSGSLFYFASAQFHVSLPVGLLVAFVTSVGNEIFEIVTQVENSFHSPHVFKRDRLLAVMSVSFTVLLAKFNWLTGSLLAPISLVTLTSYIDSKLVRIKTTKRNWIKPFVDVSALTAGPAVCMLIVSLYK